MKITSLLAGSLLTALAFTSCLSDSDNAKNEATFTLSGESCFNYVYDYDTEDAALFDGPTYKMTYNFTDATLQVDMTGLKVSADMAPVSLRLPSINYTPDQSAGLYIARQRNMAAVNASNYMFNSFEFYSAPERFIAIGGQAVLSPLYIFTYELNGQYRVTTFPVQTSYLGNSSSITLNEDGTDGRTYNYDGNLVAVNIDYKKKTANVSFLNTIFAEKMPAQSFEIRGIPVEFHEGGYNLVSEADVTYPIYSSSGKEMKDCSANTVTGSSTLITGKTAFRFDIDLSGQTASNFTFGKYKVFTSLSYYGFNSSGN